MVRKIRTIFAGQRVFVYLPRFIGVVVGEEFVTIERGRTIVLIAWGVHACGDEESEERLFSEKATCKNND